MRSYVRTFLATLITALSLVGGFNWLINPYRLFTSPEIAGVNAFKPEIGRRQYVARPYDVERARPEVLILGNSRALHIPTEQPAWAHRRSYNLALASSSFYEQFRYFQHAVATGEVQVVLWGLDAIAFGRSTHPDFREERLAVNRDGERQPFHPGVYLRDVLPALVSADALRSSFATLHQQSQGAAMGRLIHADKAGRIRRAGGQHRMFLRLEQGAAERPAIPSRLDDMDFDAFRHALRFAYARDIDLRLFISPEHARLLELWETLGRGEVIAGWKRELVRINAQEAARAGRAPFPLWDFSGYNSITTEALPPPGDTETHMRWYWEGSHYSEAAADLIVARIFGTPHPELPGDFGRRLDFNTVDAHITATRLAREAYRNNHPDDVLELNDVLKRVGQTSAPD